MLSIIAAVLSIVISVFRIVKYILTKLKKVISYITKNWFWLRVRKKHRCTGAFP